ncbi:MAG: endonuclease III [Candidatus Woesearchaeota archaeon]
MNYDIVLKTLAKQQGISMLGQFRKYPAWKILISTILSARANDKATIPVSKELFKKYPTLRKLSEANPDDIKKIIKRCVYYNNKTKYILETAKILLKKYKGKVPDTMEELITLPGVGYKVAGCVVVYAFNKPDAIPVDTHVAVIANRLGWTKETNPDKIMFDLMKKIPKKHWLMVNELLVVHGQSICSKRNPKCSECSIEKYCKYEYKSI